MKEILRNLLVCPVCKNKMTLEIIEGDLSDVDAGIFICDNCKDWYPIEDGIPRMLPNELWQRNEFTKKYWEKISSCIDNYKDKKIEDYLTSLKQDTQKSFGFEWHEYARFGWDDPVFNIAREEKIFEYKCMLSRQELDGALCLDGGCGNGRYSYWASKKGAANVISVDISSAVEICQKNCAPLGNVHQVQADLLNLPFADNTFDRAFSIGVLMHTGDPKRATTSLYRVTKEGQTFSVHYYQKKNFIYEFIDRKIREKTVKWDFDRLMNLSKRLYRISRFLESIKMLTVFSSFIRIDNHVHCIFDWYSAPVARHLTYKEVFSWLKELHCGIVDDQREKKPELLRKILLAIHPRDAVIVKASKEIIEN